MPVQNQPPAVGRRLAAIDVGTNTIRLVVAEVLADRTVRIVDDEKVRTRLGRGLATTGALAPDAMEESAQAIAHLRSIADGRNVSNLRAVATCAVREATNSKAFIDLVREKVGLELDVIDAEQEGRLAFLSVDRAFDLSNLVTAVVDVGGGSTELVLASRRVIERIIPLRLGAMRLTERLGLGADALSDQTYRRLRREIRRQLKDAVGKPPFVPHVVIGTGGTFTNLAMMSMHRGLQGRDSAALPFAARGYEMQRSEVKHLLQRLRKMPARERARVPGLSPDRADIIVAGIAIIDCVLKHFSVNRLRIHDEGIRAGLLHQMVDEVLPPERQCRTLSPDRMRRARQFAANCQHDRQHAEHVTTLALRLFDELCRELGCENEGWCSHEARELLHAAALLHDVGYLISYSNHHKHTYHLIMHSGLADFTHRELEIIANIARYHRGARPRGKHANYQKLTSEDQQLVRRLAAILRLAVGLDRSHAQRVSDVRASSCDGMLLLDVIARDDPSVEIWGAERKSRLFGSVFDFEPHFRWSPAHHPPLDRDQEFNGAPRHG